MGSASNLCLTRQFVLNVSLLTCAINGVITAPTLAIALQQPRPRALLAVG